MSSLPGYFEKKREELLKRISEARELKNVNNQLHQFNWMFIHPNLFGGDLMRLREQLNKPDTTANHITAIFADAFYDFRTTILLVEGYVFTCPSIAPFSRLIDECIVLAVQHDYAGAINILIPVIEGSMRNYLVNNKGKQQSNIMRTEDLMQAFTFLRDDYIQERKADYKSKTELDQSKVNRLIDLERQYFNHWLEMISTYFENCLYLHTKGGSVADALNRHSILHGFTNDIYYDLSNFLKVFHTLYFLAWMFGAANASIPQHVELTNEDICEKWSALQQLRALNEITLSLKAKIYQNDPRFDETSFRWEPLDRRMLQIAKFQSSNLEEKLVQIHRYILENSKA